MMLIIPYLSGDQFILENDHGSGTAWIFDLPLAVVVGNVVFGQTKRR